MIGSLRGTLSEVALGDTSAELVVDVRGVGYVVEVAPRLAAELGLPGSPVTLAVHTHVREGAITLFGFASPGERRAFELLIGAHGVGPALALSILSTFTPDALARALAAEDVDALVLAPGVGRKTAARLVVELAPRAAELAGMLTRRWTLPEVAEPGPAAGESGGAAGALGTRPAGQEAGAGPVAGGLAGPAPGAGGGAHAEVAEALAALGYSQEEVRSVVLKISREGSVEQLLREALRELAPSS
ncbi:MAG: Holliday junction branch migration protein RuvA [Actinomycetota bacterium]|nr:Holliday junction branch migration protein RuvA [Actinomycetota bacterium]